jgi:hypothetical protein
MRSEQAVPVSASIEILHAVDSLLANHPSHLLALAACGYAHFKLASTTVVSTPALNQMLSNECSDWGLLGYDEETGIGHFSVTDWETPPVGTRYQLRTDLPAPLSRRIVFERTPA